MTRKSRASLPPNQQPLAIVGMGCRLPGGNNLEAYWDMIRSGRSAIGVLPPSRLDQKLYFSETPSERPRTLTRLGGFVSPYLGIRDMHRLKKSDVAAADPSHLEMVSVMEDAVAHAGWNETYFEGIKSGVYMGHTRGTGRTGELVYRSLVPQTAEWLKESPGFCQLEPLVQDQVIQQVVGEVQSRYPGRNRECPESLEAYQGSLLIAKAFGLDGPSVSLNAACASSLIALSMAGQALRLGKIDVAVVGSGSFVEFDSLVLFSRAGSVSQTGSRPFDAGADGLVAAEGYIVLLLKTLERALQDQDKIVAVIRGMGYSSDGKGKSLWAPRKEGQVLAIQRAFGETLTPTRVRYIEAHATSTAVGDATEMSALIEALGPHLQDYPRIPIGSVKANIGHTLESAGLAGLVKAVLAINQKTIPPVAYVKTPNPKIDWERAPFYLPKAAEEWKTISASQPRRAGVNAFGIGGLNAHIVIDEFIETHIDQYFVPDRECVDHKQTGAPNVEELQPQVLDSSGNEKIAIIGIGIIAPGGHSAEEFWNATKDGTRWLTSPPVDRFRETNETSKILSSSKMKGGFLQNYAYDWRKHKVPPKQVENADPLQFMLLDAVDQALKDTKIPFDKLPRARTGVVIGSVFGGEFGNALQMGLRLPEFSDSLKRHLESIAPNTIDSEKLIDDYQSLLLKRMPALIDETGSFTSSTLASRITKTFDVMGGGVAMDAGGSSGIAALESCVNALQSNDADLMICAAGQRSCGQFVLEMLVKANAMSASGDAKVWSNSSDGFAPAEGAAVVILKRYADAQRDGNKIYSVINKIEIASGKDLQEAFCKVDTVLKSAISNNQDAELTYIESASNGTKTDQSEINALANVFGADATKPVRICALREQIGDCFGAAGLMGIIRASMALQSGIVPSVSNYPEKRIPASLRCSDSPTVLWDSQNPSPGLAVVHAACERFASGVLLGNVESVRAEEASHGRLRTEGDLHVHVDSQLSIPSTANRIYRFGGDSISELLFLLNQASKNEFFSDTSNETKMAPGKSSLQSSEYRVNIVANGEASYRSRIQLAMHALDQGKSLQGLQNQGIFFGRKNSQTNTEIAFVFSGQGSQYPGMLVPFLDHDETSRTLANSIDSSLKVHLKRSLRETLADDNQVLGKDLESTQLAILSCEILLFEAVRNIGLTPSRLAGHSFGEYGAMYGAGCWDIPNSMFAAVKRSQAVANSNIPPGKLLCAFCDETVASQACDAVASNAFIANCNTSSQTVIGGSASSIEQVKEWLTCNRVRSTVLNVPFAFHTPMMKAASLEMKQHVSDIKIQPTMRSLLSTVSECYDCEPEQLRSNLVEQLIKPVRWTKLIHTLYNDGVRMFVEIGPSQVLTNLNRYILKDFDDVICVASDDPKSTTLEQLVLVEAAKEIWEHSVVIYSRNPELVPSSTICNEVELASSSSTFAKSGFDSKTVESNENQSTQHSNSLKVMESEFSRKPSVHSVFTHPVSLNRTENSDSSVNDSFGFGDELGRRYRSEIRDILDRFAALPVSTSEVDYCRDLTSKRMIDWLGGEGIRELQGLARGAWATEESMLRLNVELATRMVAGRLHYCSAPHNGNLGSWLHGFTENQASYLKLDFQLRRPAGFLRNVTVGVPGQIGGLAGMNESRISMTSAALLNRTKNAIADRSITSGLLQPILTLKVLQEATSIDEAIDLCRTFRGAGAWGVMLLDGKKSKGGYVEFDESRFEFVKFDHAYTASNHFQLLSSPEHPPADSLYRIENAKTVLNRLNGTSGNPLHVWNVLGGVSPSESLIYHHPKGPASSVASARNSSNVQAVLMDPSEMKIWISSPTVLNKDDRTKPFDFSTFFEMPVISSVDDVQPMLALDSNPSNLQQPHTINSRELAVAGNSVNGSPPLGDTDKVCTRLAVKLIRSNSQVKTSDPAFVKAKRFLILGNNPVVSRVSQSIRASGGTSHTIELSQDASKTLVQYEELSKIEASFDAVLVLNAWDEITQSIRSISDPISLDHEILGTFLVAQKWFSTLGDEARTSPAFFVTASTMGGDLGISGTSPRHSGGATSGLSKAMSLERSVMVGPDLRTHAIDFDLAADPDFVADRILSEMQEPYREAEVAYQNGKRFVVRMVQELVSVNGSTDSLPDSLSDGCWIVSGGARGVTAEIAKALGSRVRGTIHLIGSSPLPEIQNEWLSYNDLQIRELRTEVVRKAVQEKKQPAEAWGRIEKAIEIAKNLHFMQAQGLKVKYHACDISQRVAVEQLVADIRKGSEPIVGVVHGAGFEKASRFSGKKIPLVMRTIESKVLGAINLMNATSRDPIRSFVAFTSISGRYGAIGQTDYGLANEWLTKVVSSYRNQRPGVHAVAMDWHSWDEVGMAARPETKHSALLKTMRFMPVAEGVLHFLNEVIGRSEATEVVITDWQYHKMFFPDPVSPAVDASEFDDGDGAASTLTQAPLSAKVSNQREVEQATIDPSVANSVTWNRSTYKLEATDSLIDSSNIVGSAMIVGDNKMAVLLHHQLVEMGIDCFRVAVPATDLDWEKCNKRLQAKFAGEPVSNLFIMTAYDEESRLGGGWNQHQNQLKTGLHGVKRLLQQWMEHSHANEAADVDWSLVIAADFGGSFGLSADGINGVQNRVHAPVTGAFVDWTENIGKIDDAVGPCKVRVKVVDVDTTLPPLERARLWIAESAAKDGSRCIAHNTEGRFRRVQLPSHNLQLLSRSISRRKGTCVVVGAKAHKDSQEFVSLSKELQAELQFIDLQSEAYQSTDPLIRLKAMRQDFSRIRKDCRDSITDVLIVESKSDPANFVSAVNTDSLEIVFNVMEVTRPDALQSLVVLHQPIASIDIGSDCSNRFNCCDFDRSAIAFWLQWYRSDRTEVKVKSMCGLLSSTLALELDAGRCIANELLSENSDWDILWNRLNAESVAASKDGSSSIAKLSFTPTLTLKNAQLAACEIILDPVTDPFLAQHLFRGKPLMPIVGIVELFWQSAIASEWIDDSYPIKIEDLAIINGFKFLDPHQKTVQVLLEESTKSIEANLVYDFYDSKGRLMEKNRRLAKASVARSDEPAKISKIQDAANAPWYPVHYPGPEMIIYHGPAFRCLHEVQHFENGLLARFRAQSPSQLGGERLGTWMLPMGILDSSLFACGVLCWTLDPKSAAIPAAIERVVVYSQVNEGEEYLGSFTIRSIDSNEAIFDGFVSDSNGKVILELVGFSATLVNHNLN